MRVRLSKYAIGAQNHFRLDVSILLALFEAGVEANWLFECEECDQTYGFYFFTCFLSSSKLFRGYSFLYFCSAQ